MAGEATTGYSVDASPDSEPPEKCRLVRYVAAGEVAVMAESDGDAGEAFADLIASADAEKARELLDGAHFEISEVVPASEATFE